MNTLSYRTVSVSAEKAERKWYVVDAENQVVGRLCAQIATVLRGKNKPSYTPHADTGDYVIVLNADKVRFTGKKWAQKEYKDFSHHPGGLRVTMADEMQGYAPKNQTGQGHGQEAVRLHWYRTSTSGTETRSDPILIKKSFNFSIWK
jgi:ribosomal protein L13